MTSKSTFITLMLLSVCLWANPKAPLHYAEELSQSTWKAQQVSLSPALSDSNVQTYYAISQSDTIGTIAISTVLGKTDPITFGIALDSTGKTVGFSVFETRGSHDARLLSRFWQRQFLKKETDAIDAVSGASISSGNVVKQVKKIKQRGKN